MQRHWVYRACLINTVSCCNVQADQFTVRATAHDHVFMGVTKRISTVFIVLEGGEGAGKTTVMAVLADALVQAGHTVLATREPGGTPEGLALRGLLLADGGPAWDPGAELLLMTAARVQHVRRVIAPALQAGLLVLCDRYIGSTLAYQGAGRGLPADLILDLHHRIVAGPEPDLTVLLDVDPHAGLARSRRRLRQSGANEGRFEALDLAFHQRVRAAFLAHARTVPSVAIDAGAPQSSVIADVLARVTGWLERVHD